MVNMKRHELLNEIIKRNGYKKYLEIGIDNPELCFNLIEVDKKIGVDPYNDKLGTHQWNANNLESFKEAIDGEWYEMTSNEFFKKKRNKFDIIFIDGLHQEKQVDKDIKNALSRLHDGGMVVLHDTMPKVEDVQTNTPTAGAPWMGDCYRSFWKLRMERDDLDLATVDIDTGFSFIRAGSNVKYTAPNFKGHMSFMYFKLHRTAIMNIISLNNFWSTWCK
jgi:hypothetical protein